MHTLLFSAFLRGMETKRSAIDLTGKTEKISTRRCDSRISDWAPHQGF
jgi:hypothetical protein